jgi:hypothetical protein
MIPKRHEVPPKSTNPQRLRSILTAIALSALYLLSLWFSISEAERRSVRLEIPPEGDDYLSMDVNVVQVDLLRAEMTTRISFRLAGQLAQDELTPATDLQLVLNTVHGQQQFDFAKGERINPIEAVFPLQGDVHFYPFDRHTGVLWLLATIPEKSKRSSKPNSIPKQPAIPHGPSSRQKQEPDSVPAGLAESPGLPVGASTLKERVQADTRTNFTASIPGVTFRGSNLVESAQGMKGLTGIQVDLKRSQNVILISLASMLMMAALAVGLVTMVMRIVSGTRHMANFHIPMAVSLIFGLPALRNIQPGIPPIGTFGDSVAFTWAETAAAGSAIALVIHWLLYPSKPPTKQS